MCVTVWRNACCRKHTCRTNVCPRTCTQERLIFHGPGLKITVQLLKGILWKRKITSYKRWSIECLISKRQRWNEEKGGTILSHFTFSALFPYDHVLYGCMSMVALRNILLKHIEDNKVQKWVWFDVHVSCKVIDSYIFCLVQLVEGRLKQELANTKGGLLFDGWSCDRVHYVWLAASFNISVCVRKARHLKYSDKGRKSNCCDTKENKKDRNSSAAAVVEEIK